jgi:hypothetical protein
VDLLIYEVLSDGCCVSLDGPMNLVQKRSGSSTRKGEGWESQFLFACCFTCFFGKGMVIPHLLDPNNPST